MTSVRTAPPPPPVLRAVDRLIVVAGMPSGGTSLVAGLLHHLGVDMGRCADGVQPGPREYEGFECLDCWEGGVRGAFDATRGAEFVGSVAAYLKRRLGAPARPCGVKHNPLVWLGMFDGIAGLPIRVVHAQRPLDEVFASDRRYRGDDPRRAAQLGMAALALARLLEQSPPVARLDFGAVVADPGGAIAHLVEALELAPTAAQRDAARTFVDPAKRHVGRPSAAPAR